MSREAWTASETALFDERTTARGALLLALMTALALGGCGPSVRTVSEVVVEPTGPATERIDLVTDRGLPGRSYAELTDDGAWSWFGDPRAVYHKGEHSRTYVGWVTSEGDVAVGSYDHDTGEVNVGVVHEKLQKDDHASPAILVRPDGRLTVFYSGHRGRWMFYRTSSRPEDVTEWGMRRAVAEHTSDLRGNTYPNPVRLSGEDDRWYVFWRGPGYAPTYAFTDDAMNWTEPAPFIDGEGERPYFKVCSDGDSTIHFAFNQDHPDNDPSNNVYYLCYSDGAFRRADGTEVASMNELPVWASDADLVYDAGSEGARAWVWDIAIDHEGRPVIVYAAFPEEEDHRYRYARWDGHRWEDRELTYAGWWFPSTEPWTRRFEAYYSGGVALDHEDPRVVYISRPTGGVFELERWYTPDGGETWQIEPVTAGSIVNNVRPVVPLGHVEGGPELVWMRGTYLDYMDYSTALMLK